MSETERILIVGPAWVGDMVMSHALVRTLAGRFPAAVIDMLAPGWSRPIVERMPHVRQAIDMPLGHGQFDWPARHRLGKRLRAARYDRAVVLPRSFKSALVPYHAKIPIRTGFRGEYRYGLLNDVRPLDKSVLTQTVQRYVALGLPRASAAPLVPPPRLRVDSSRRAQLRTSLELDANMAAVGFVPGAEYGPAKQWPVEYFGRLAARLAERNQQVWVFGSAKEHELGAAIAKGNPAVRNLCGKTELADVVDLFSGCKAIVSNDSGLMHVAAAVGAPVVAIYGSSSPSFTPPLSDAAKLLFLDIECAPCFARDCRFGHYRCLRDITPEQVLAALG